LALFASAFAQITVNYKANTNVTLVNGNDYKYRSSTSFDISVPGLYSGFFASSTSLDVNPNSLTIDGVYGSAYAGLQIPPSSYLAFYTGAATWQATADYRAANVSGSNGFVGSVFISLDEVTTAGNVVQTIQLKDLVWVEGTKSVGQGGLRYVSFKGTVLLNANFAVTATYVVSNVVGVLDVVGVPVITPKSMESIIEITNFPYMSTANSIRLNVVVGMVATQVQAQGTVTHLVAGAGPGTSYFSVNRMVQVNGQATTVDVKVNSTGQTSATFGNSNLAGQVTARYGAAALFQLVSVSFPAGATDVVFDPSIGTGASPPAVGSAATLAPSFVAFFICVVKLLL